MIPGFRYHVITVAAIFLALGVGIIIGSSFVQSAIVDRQARALDKLGQQFDRDVLPLKDQNRRYSDSVAALGPQIVRQQCAGRRIAIVQTGDYPDVVRKLTETFEQAGATVARTTVIEPAFISRATTGSTKLTEKLRAGGVNPAGDTVKGLLHNLAIAVWSGVPAGDANPPGVVGIWFTAATDLNLVRRDGDYSGQVDYVILVGGASDENESRAESVDVPLIGELKALGASVVEAEPEAAGISYIGALRAAEIPTIDNADSDLGRIAVALALRAPVGDYGVKKTARSGILPTPK